MRKRKCVSCFNRDIRFGTKFPIGNFSLLGNRIIIKYIETNNTESQSRRQSLTTSYLIVDLLNICLTFKNYVKKSSLIPSGIFWHEYQTKNINIYRSGDNSLSNHSNMLKHVENTLKQDIYDRVDTRNTQYTRLYKVSQLNNSIDLCLNKTQFKRSTFNT